MPSGSLIPARSFCASSMMPIERSVPAMTNRPCANSMSPAAASSTCEAICLPCSTTLPAASTMAVPLCMIDFEPPVPPPAISSSLSPCSSRMLLERNAELLAQHLRERRRRGPVRNRACR